LNTANIDGQSSVQDLPPGAAEGEDFGGEPTPNLDSRYEELDARVAGVNDSLVQIQQTLAQLASSQQRPQVQEVIEDFDDEEPLTAAKANRLVKTAVSQAVNQSSQASERTRWDDKAREKFPLSDPKFDKTFRQEWKHFQEAGGDVNHPKAIYNVCNTAARLLKADQTQRSNPARNSGEEMTGETPNPSARAVTGGASKANKISDDDPRVRFYAMRPNVTPEKINAYKEKLAAATEKRRRR